MTLASLASVEVRPSRTILAVCTVGRATCAAPIIEICRILHARGHRIEFACLAGWQKLAAPHDFIARTHIVGRDLTEQEDEHLYRVLDASGIQTHDERVKMFQGFDILFSWWTETYSKIRRLCQDIQPGFLFVDELADSAMDVARELHIPFAGMAPQSPPVGISCCYISGMPGYQIKHLTNEHASLWDRIREELGHLKLLVAVRAAGFGEEGAMMRREAGLNLKPPPGPGKPDHLFFVNSFFGLEVPKELPPMVRPVGPVLADTWPALSTSPHAEDFLSSHQRVLYMAFGTHIVTPDERKKRVVSGINAALREGTIDGVIWAMKPAHTSSQVHRAQDLETRDREYELITRNHCPHWLVQPWLPQRAILDHPSVCMYFAHCGGSSTVEAAYHGVPVLAMPGYGDQFGHAMRLEAAGVAVRLDKNLSTAQDITSAIRSIAQDEYGMFARNVLRLRRIAHVNAERKYLAAQMIEEVIYDSELRFDFPPRGREWLLKNGGAGTDGEGDGFAHGRELRACHVETADMRMSLVKRLNLDLMVARLFYPPLLVLSYMWEIFTTRKRES